MKLLVFLFCFDLFFFTSIIHLIQGVTHSPVWPAEGSIKPFASQERRADT